MRNLTFAFVLASAAVALATVTVPQTAADNSVAVQTLAVACCDDPPPQCWPLPCNPPDGGNALKAARP